MLLNAWLNSMKSLVRRSRLQKRRVNSLQTEALEDRVLLAAQITASPITTSIPTGGTTDVDVFYSETNGDFVTGLTLRLHYDSSELTFDETTRGTGPRIPNGLTNVFGEIDAADPLSELRGLNAVAVQDDTADQDDDPATDKFVNFLWVDPSFTARWPRATDFDTTPLRLFTASFGAAAGFDGAATVNFSAEAGVDTSQSVTLTEPPPTPTVTIGDATVEEGGVLLFPVSLSGAASAGDVTVDVATSNGSAIAGTDFTDVSRTITFTGGVLTQNVAVTTLQDDVPENTKTLSLTLSNAVNADLASDVVGAGTITNDGDQATVSLSGNQTVVEGGSMTYTVSLDFAPLSDVTVDIATSDGTAEGATDFGAVAQTLTFTPTGPLTQTVTVNTTEDDTAEGIESFSIALSNIVGAAGSGSATATITDDDGNGSISGLKFHDRNLNGTRDANEETLSGWVITLTDTATDATRTATTGADGTYVFTEVAPGTYTVTETLQAGFRQSFPVNALTQTAYELDQTLNLFSSGNDFEDWGGLGERWVQGDLTSASSRGWYYITPTGAFFEWDGSPRTQLTGDFVAQLSSDFHTDLDDLHDAAAPNGHEFTLASNEQVADIDFGNYEVGSISGNIFEDLNENGVADSDEPSLAGLTVQLIDTNGAIVSSTVTDADGDYAFSDLTPGDYFVREIPLDGFVQTFPAIDADAVLAEDAFYLDQERGFIETENNFLDWGGRDEKWFQSSTGYHFVTPNGKIFDWDGSSREALTGILVGELDSSYYDDPTLIYDAQFPGGTTISVGSGESVTQNFGNAQAVTGIGGDSDFGEGNVSATVRSGDLVITGDNSSNGVAIALDDAGNLVVIGTGNTTINGSDEAYVAFQTTNAVPDDLRIDLNGGDNLLTIQGINVNDDVRIVADDGDDHVLFENVSVFDDLYIDTNDGDDIVGLNGVTVADLTSVYTDDGNDVIAVVDSVHQSNVRLRVNDGNDSVYADDSQFGSDVDVNLGDGNDNVAIMDSSVADEADLDGGSGSDSLLIENSTAGSLDQDLESDMIPNLDDNIDAVLAELAVRGIDFSF